MGKCLIIKGANFSGVSVGQILPYPEEASHFFPLTENLNDTIGNLVFNGSHSGISDEGVLFKRKNNEGLKIDNDNYPGFMFDYKYVSSGSGNSVNSEYLATITDSGNGRPILTLAVSSEGVPTGQVYFKGESTSATESISINLLDGKYHRIFIGNISTYAYLIIDGNVIMTQNAYGSFANAYFLIGNGKSLIAGSATTNPAEGYFKNVCLFSERLTLNRAIEISTL